MQIYTNEQECGLHPQQIAGMILMMTAYSAIYRSEE
jgi:hypothetical protein